MIIDYVIVGFMFVALLLLVYILFKSNNEEEIKEEIKEENTFKIFEEDLPDDYRIEVTKKDDKCVFEVYKDELYLGAGDAIDFGESYLWGKKFIDRLEDTEPIILQLYYEDYNKSKCIINHHSASYILDNFTDKEVEAIEFYDYGRDKFFSIKKDVLKEISLKNYIE